MVFGDMVQSLDKLLAALLGQRRNGYADEFTVVPRIEAEVGGADRLLDRSDLRHVPRRDGNQRRLRHVQVGKLVQRRRRAVVIDANVIQDAQRGAAGADGRHLMLEIGDRLLHPRLQAALNVLNRTEGLTARSGSIFCLHRRTSSNLTRAHPFYNRVTKAYRMTVPTSSPIAIRMILPCWFRLN